MSARLGLAIVGGCEAAVVLYALIRLLQATFGKEPNPILVVTSDHSGFFWRSWTVGYVGVMVAFVTWTLARSHEARVASVLANGAWIAGVVIALQSALVP